ncbi:FxsB family cyclophane-forming radical SAM/SPASM peptide maturase [Kitasatospora viridis]|uniref:FxsB family cyclophane-forming radical SAM/SPASM peptide maturase n=1 Tax=Kitasatospora viridis TaxID=281105 RepID=UPI001FE85303|nr:FxsB family cyclophane-forming radical SAM/SPASM peptide maturase [Kitasatospora viridis]
MLVPFAQFVLKVHSRCDLACDHCYVYEHADTSWRGRPKAVSTEVLDQAARRIGEHAEAHRLPAVHVVLHGGEPLLAGPALLRHAARRLRAELPPGCELDLRIHTNAVRLNERFLELFLAERIKVGVSLDGDRAANDRHRRFADGRSSHPQVLAAVELLRAPRYRELYAGLLCTIDVANDPVAVLDALLELDPPHLDFLLPHATWDAPPPRLGRDTPYADWLLTVHQRWLELGRPVPVRSFDSIRRTLLGLSSLTESLGLDPADLVVIETDGSFEQADSLKTAFDGAPATGFDIFANSLDEVARHPGMMARQSGLAGLSAQCRACPVVRSCGGGLYAHRWRTPERRGDAGFDNPSVFCGDLMRLITTIRDRVAPALPPGVRPGTGPTGEQLDQLARGYGDAATVRALAAGQLDLTRRLLAAVGPADARAWQLLTLLDAEAPQAVDAVLAHPYVRAWAVSRLRGGPGAEESAPLAEIAAAASLRAGRREELPVPVRGGAVHLPTLGRLLVGGSGEAVLRGGPASFAVRAPGGARFEVAHDQPGDERWLPVRRVELPGGWTVALEDLDPHRDSHQWPAEQRLTAGALADWTGALREAWELTRRDLPQYADGIAAGLSTITPLRPGPNGRDVSAAARQAFGAVGIARPATAPALALLLVHEFQHVKLGAVLDFHDLFDRGDRRLFEAPWREDPRPLEGLFQGCYAHLAVVEHWAGRVRAYDGLAGEAAGHAREQLARWHGHTARACETLLGSGALTPLGERFARGLAESVARVPELEPAPERLVPEPERRPAGAEQPV